MRFSLNFLFYNFLVSEMSFEVWVRATGNFHNLTEKNFLEGYWYEKNLYRLTNFKILFIFPCDNYFGTYLSYYILVNLGCGEILVWYFKAGGYCAVLAWSAWYHTPNTQQWLRGTQSRLGRPKIFCTKNIPYSRDTLLEIENCEMSIKLAQNKLTLESKPDQ